MGRLRQVLRTVLTILVGTVIYAIGTLTSAIALVANPWAFDDTGKMSAAGAVFVLVLVVLWASVFVRRRWPLVPFVIGAVLAAAWCDSLLMLIGVFHLIIRAPRRQAVTATIIGAVLCAIGVLRLCLLHPARNPFGIFFLPDPDQAFGVESYIPSSDSVLAATIVTILSGVFALGISLGFGYLLRRTKRMAAIERVADRETQRNETLSAELARRSERELLARELHDTLSHRLSVISLHSGALEVGSKDDGDVASTASTLRHEAHASLEDLRQLVGGVREGTLADSGPQKERSTPPSLASMRSIPQLIASVQSTGTVVRPSIIIQDVESASTSFDRAVYRIVQESLTNAMKHAPGAPVTVDVNVSAADGARIRVSNPAPHSPRRDPLAEAVPPRPTTPPLGNHGHRRLASTGSGSGLEGIRERTAMLDGEATIGLRDGDFVVEAVLPPFPRKS